ncbi:MAG: glycoside hydrolase family 2 TIM barrel-domain containing protein [Mangrovibacterium sp.]
MKLNQLILILFFPGLLFAQKTEIRYLSGTGADNTVTWEFYCSAGQNSGKWTTIQVPSCWEQQGFGAYNFGRDELEGRLNETGTYKYRFTVPSSWKGKQINIVFEGVMTDARVKINGKPIGPVHQGSFYQFKYNINKLIRLGQENELEVFVKKHSDFPGINQAERHADYWVFGGIFRPVYLEAKPLENIHRIAVNARADGGFTADVYLTELKNAAKVVVEIQDMNGKKETRFETKAVAPVTRFSEKMTTPQIWSPEFPNLYNAVFSLLDKNNRIIHQTNEQIGFRTVEVRESDGIYVNGVRVKLKGVCRHTFRPQYGRTSCKTFSIEDVNLMKDMNINAVRMSHYPPEKHFLDVCDSLGLFVIDEFTAWPEPPPGSQLAHQLLEDMIARDVNHPSVILWDNGNEGMENRNLDDDFARLDIQKRKVLHPWQDYDLINTLHYIDYNYLSHDGFSKRKIFLPTEFLHGLHDGGLGAGLDDYWQKMWDEPLCAGGFLWVFADESVERTDRNRELDPHGNYAPDGILGPYHEKEGSFYTIREIWSPVCFEKRCITSGFDGIFRIENRFFYTNLDQCSFIAEWVNFPGPDESPGEKLVGTENLNTDLVPGAKGLLKVALPPGWKSTDVLRIKMMDPSGRHLNTWTWPVKHPGMKAGELLTETSSENPIVQETDKNLTVKTGKIEISFSKTDGTIQQLMSNGQQIPLSNGPVLVSREKSVKQVTHRLEGNDLFVETLYGNDDWTKWTIHRNGLLDLEVAYEPADNCLFAGITFDFREETVAGMKWLGNGPYRVYKNRMKGTGFGLWEKAYNNSVTGESGFVYPEFKGYHSGMYWVKIFGENSPDFTVYVHSNDIFLRMLTPPVPQHPRNTTIVYPPGDLSFLHGISGIGTKFTDAPASGPQSFPYYFSPVKIHERKLSMKLTFDFRNEKKE